MKIDKVTPQIAALYLGQKCDIEWLNDNFTNNEIWESEEIVPDVLGRLGYGQLSITPHLRRLDSITEDEAKELFAIESDDKFVKSIYHESYTNLGLGFSYEKEWALDSFLPPRFFSPEQFLSLLSRGFDLFGLIDASLAKEVNPEQ